ncbi:hypothetical protein RCL_jg18048.t1 [Rhizophagus clarus]|uniref:Uncharacterized protein n=1 Tax=Rhizophagus clarus TaxID=94130 RepID=A0A8H3QLR7_9GLOM|nr:hypothetical protein RCL_jg18048.t1 [Rhizophagus clarus]
MAHEISNLFFIFCKKTKKELEKKSIIKKTPSKVLNIFDLIDHDIFLIMGRSFDMTTIFVLRVQRAQNGNWKPEIFDSITE